MWGIYKDSDASKLICNSRAQIQMDWHVERQRQADIAQHPLSVAH
jgi:hypothetical protein